MARNTRGGFGFGGKGQSAGDGQGGMAPNPQGEWMLSPFSINAQVHEICTNLLNVRNGYKQIRDNMDYFCNPPTKAKSRFVEITEKLFGYLSQLRTHYASDDGDARLKQMTEYYETKLATINQQLQEEKKAKQSALTRISELSSRMLKSGNADVTELSDPNRPMKLAEELNAVYDNEWTDAYEALTEEKGKKDDEAIDILYGMLQKCHELCLEAASKQYNQLEDVATTPTLLLPKQPKEKSPAKSDKKGAPKGKKGDPEDQDLGTDELETTTKIEPYIKEFRKVVASEATKTAVAEIMTVLKQSKFVPDDLLANPAVNQYLQKTARVCWLMVTQFPPLILKLELKAGDKFDFEILKEYRTRGKKIVRPVWPPVYLHANGPLISKGFADGDGAK